MIKLLYFLLALLLIALAVLQNLLWLAALFAIVFTYFYGAVALFVLALCIDGYFGAFETFPVFSAAMTIWYVISESVRLRMRIME